MLKDFIDSRIVQWQKLEDYVSRLRRQRRPQMSRAEVREFGRLYRRTAADLAIAHEEIRDSRLVNYLNSLVVRTHGIIYRTEKTGLRSIIEFFRYELPAVFRQTFRYTLLAFLLFLAGSLFGAGLTLRDDHFADANFPGIREQVVRRINWTSRLNQDNPGGATSIQINNIMVTFNVFVGGLTAGLWTVYSLLFNGLMLGTVTALCFKYKFYEILIFITGHGVLELSAIFISGGAGFLLAEALLMPQDLTRRQAFLVNGRKAIKLIFGVVVMLLFAGAIEGFISPAEIHPNYKFAVSISSGLAMVIYFLKPDRRQQRNPATS